MCGRYMAVTEGEIIEIQTIFEELGKRLDRKGEPLRSESGEVFPGSMTPVIAAEGDRVTMVPMFWGFRKWDGKGIVFNARSETAADKPFFRDPLRSGRCIVPSKGFFEWMKYGDDGTKHKSPDKYFIRKQDSSFFFMAGIYRLNGDVQEFSILTMPAPAQMSHIHDRMPVYLPDTLLLSWLSDPGYMDLLKGDTGTAPSLEITKV